jgi:hypothetical protein
MSTAPANTDASELFALAPFIAGLDVEASNDGPDDEGQVMRATVGGRCPGGCSGGYVPDPRGPSRHDPMGLRACPVCG